MAKKLVLKLKELYLAKEVNLAMYTDRQRVMKSLIFQNWKQQYLEISVGKEKYSS